MTDNAVFNAIESQWTSARPSRVALDRLVAAVMRRVRLHFVRLLFPRARFGTRCDIRRSFELRMGAAARVEFGEGCVLDNDMIVECAGTLRVGARTIFGHHCTLAARDSVTIGEDCLIAELVSHRISNSFLITFIFLSINSNSGIYAIMNIWILFL